ncbi:MAG: helix-turn-helix transcriptional regulator [Clostridia bacterium]|nr:helix-turn-helix transcriptional regulator [Clostridia bacterium]
MNNNFDYTAILCENIGKLRRAKGFTQDELASMLGITFQAVSKWETGGSCPDMATLPKLASILGASIDALFGIEKEVKKQELSWEDDGKLHVAVFEGTRPVSQTEYRNEKMKIAVQLEGNVRDVACDCCVVCENIGGDVLMTLGSAKGGQLNIACENIEGDVIVSLKECEKAPVTIACDDIEGDVTVSSSADITISCDNIEGDVTLSTKAECSVTCDNIDGDVTVTGQTRISSGNIAGNITSSDGTAECYITCDNVDGDVAVTGKATINCDNIDR